MSDNFTEITHSSWGGRILGSIGGMFIGVILAIVAVPLLFWNEGRTIKTTRALEEASANFAVVSPESVQPAHEGKLVYVSGPAETSEVLHDPIYGISANALILSRTAEMYQWEQKESSHKEKNLGGSEDTVTTYSYVKGWHAEHIDSSQFKHPEGHLNPTSSSAVNSTFTAGQAHLGAFSLPGALLGQLSADEPLPLGEKDLAKLPASIRGNAHLSGTEIYIGRDPATEQIGDVRVSFKTLSPGVVSLIAQQTGKTFAPYVAKSGKTVERIEKGPVSAAEMFAHAKSENRVIAWIVRGGGFFIMFLGFTLVTRPVSVLGDIIPFIGSLIEAGAAFFGFAAALLVSSVTVAVAWFAYRPLLSGSLVAAALLVWYLLHRAHRKPVGA